MLSSCQSGVGTIRDGEGVFGLNRAFLLAGASSVISSLWRVPDGETTELMRDIYESQASGFPVDLTRAQRMAISRLRQAGRLDHPYYWGAFVLTRSGLN